MVYIWLIPACPHWHVLLETEFDQSVILICRFRFLFQNLYKLTSLRTYDATNKLSRPLAAEGCRFAGGPPSGRLLLIAEVDCSNLRRFLFG